MTTTDITGERFEWDPPVVLPAPWMLEERAEDGARYISPLLGLVAILSLSRELDGRRWLHLSVSHVARLPRWRELVEVKEMLLGDVYAYQVLPPRVKYVNIHERVLHLWHCLDGEPLPDFTRGGSTI